MSTTPAPADRSDPTGGRRVILVSNRGPVQYGRDGDERTTTRGAGGLLTALSGLGQHLQDGVWVCAAMTDEDVVVAQESPGGQYPPQLGEDRLRVRLVALDREAQDAFYGVIANPLLWFIQHHLYDLNTAPNITRRETDAFQSGDAAVNRRFAEVVAEEVDGAGGEAIVMIADRLGVKPATAQMWNYRDLLPPPRWTVSRQPARAWPDIEAWAARTGRLDRTDH
jgi:trehalose-6-phosphate synthase